MDKIMVCKELYWIENDRDKMHYYKVPEEWGESVKEGNFIYVVGLGTEKLEFAIAQIIKIDDLINFDQQFDIPCLETPRRC